jgi:PAS domain S-box-containing protein
MEPHRSAETPVEGSFEELYEQAPCGYFSTAPDGTFVQLNQTFLSWTGYPRDELLGLKRFQDLLTGGGRIYYETYVAPLLQLQGVASEIAFDLVCRDGRRLPVLLNSVQKRDPSGKVLVQRTAVFHASERREYEQQLLLARRQADQAIARVSRLLAISAALAKALGPARVAEITLEESVSALGAQAGMVVTVGTQDSGLYLASYPPDLREDVRSISLTATTPLSDAIRTGVPVIFESAEALAARYPQLAPLPKREGVVSLAAIPLTANGQAIGALELRFTTPQTFTTEDQTFLLAVAQQCGLALERAQLYEAEQTARAAAQEAVELRDTFFSIASHELRTPLTSLLGNAQLLHRRLSREAELSERDERALELIVEQALRLNKMISQMFDVGRVASGLFAIEPAPLDIGALVEQVVTELQPTLARHALIYTPPGRPLAVNGDALRLRQVLQNLLQNAIKYSPDGGPIMVAVEEQQQTVSITVSDQGIGIPQAMLPQLFQRFFRVASAEGGRVDGLGIGLYVVKEVVTLHGGSIHVESAVGVGSQFRISLPRLKDVAGGIEGMR